MALVFVHRFSFSQEVLPKNLDLLVSHSRTLRLSCHSANFAFGFSVDPNLFGLDVLCRFLRAIELPLKLFCQLE